MSATLANSLPRIAGPVRVSWVTEENQLFRRICFQGEALRGVAFSPGMDVEFRVKGRSFRYFTPAAFDPDAGAMEIVFFLQGDGPGPLWVRSLSEGCEVEVSRLSGGLSMNQRARYHAFVGDESSLGLEECLSRSISEGACWSAALETTEAPPSRALWIPRVAGGPGLHPFLAGQPRGTTFYLAGHADWIQVLRSVLVALEVPRRLIRSKVSWAEGDWGRWSHCWQRPT